jgi:hypothetical protein
VTNEEIHESIGEKRLPLHNIVCRNANWIGYILRINCLLHDATEGQMMEVNGVGRRKQILDNLRNIKKYWELKEEAEN